MAKSKIPTEITKNEHTIKWTRNPVPSKSVSNGWICGKPFGVVLHFVNKKSVPCLQEMCDHSVFCPHCHNNIAKDWRGYTPYYDDLYTPKFVMITLPYHESVWELEHLTPIQITRGALHTDPILIRHKVWRTTPIPHAPSRANPIDLGDFLVFTLFRVSEQMEWERKQKIKAKEEESKPYTAPVYQDPAVKKLVNMVRREEKANQENAEAGELFGAAVNRMTTPHTNGKPFTKPS